MANSRGRASGHRVYMLVDPRCPQTVYLSAGCGPEPWLNPQCHPQSEAGFWLLQLQEAPVVSFDGLPVSFLPYMAAQWIVRNRAAELVAMGMTVLRGTSDHPNQWSQPRG